MKELHQYLRFESKRLESDFSLASMKGRGTPQEVADYRELSFHELMKRYYPFPYKVTKGIVSDSLGGRSDSIDCVICNPRHPHIVEGRDKFSFLLADAVDIAIEIKPDVGVRSELDRALRQGLSVKQLRRVQSPFIDLGAFGELEPGSESYYRTYAAFVPYVVFSLRAKSDPQVVAGEIIDFYRASAVDSMLWLDVLVVLGVGLFLSRAYVSAQSPEAGFGVIPEGASLLFEPWAEDSLSAFFLRTNGLPPGGILIEDGVLYPYLKTMPRVESKWF